MPYSRIFSLVISLLIFQTLKSQDCSIYTNGIIYVDSSIIVSGDGSSWSNAVKELSEGLALAHKCPLINKVLVAKGTYHPAHYPFTMQADKTGVEITTGSPALTARDKVFHIRTGLEVYGGYSAGGTNRNIQLNKTVMDGLSAGGDSAYHVVLIDSNLLWGQQFDTTLIDGFTITNGKTINDASNSYVTVNDKNIYRFNGSGVFIFYATASVKNCNIVFNIAQNYGGGVYSYSSNMFFQNNFFYKNIAAAGVAIAANEGRGTILLDNIFDNNKGTKPTNGGTVASSNSNLTCKRNRFTNNSSGGAINVGGSGFSLIDRNYFNNNYAANQGGGVYATSNSGSTIINNFFDSNASLSQGGGCYVSGRALVSNNVFFNNKSTSGGGLYILDCKGSVTNNTFYKDSAGIGGGLYSSQPYSTAGYYIGIANNIFWKNNIAGRDTVGGADFFYISTKTPVVVTNNLTQANSYYKLSDNTINNQYPDFVDTLSITGNDHIPGTEDDGLMLKSTSPCVNMGKDSFVSVNAFTDIASNPRIFNKAVDMGAYEFRKTNALGKDIWLGTVSNEWENAANWSLGVVPNITLEVVINQGQPVLNSQGSCYNIFISSGASLQINSGKDLTVAE